MERIIWLTAFVVLIGIEAATMTLCTIWFAIGALVSFFLTLAGVGKYGQLAAFFAVSCVLFFFTRPVALRYVNQKTVKTNVDELIGKKAVITEDVDNDRAAGTAVLDGREWTARSADGSVIEAGALAEIMEIQGGEVVCSYCLSCLQ